MLPGEAPPDLHTNLAQLVRSLGLAPVQVEQYLPPQLRSAQCYLPQPTALRYHSMLALDRRCVVVAGGENFRARRNISSALLVCLYRCVVLSTAQWYHYVLLISAASRPRAGTSWPRTMAAPRTAPRSSPAASTSSAGGRRPGCWTPCAGSWSGHNMSVYISCHFLSQVTEGFRIHHICVIYNDLQ